MSSQESKLFEHARDKHFGPPNSPSRGRNHFGIPAHNQGTNGDRRRNPRSSNCSPRRWSNRRRNHPDASVFHSARQVVVTNATFANHQTVYVHSESGGRLGDDPGKASQSSSKSGKESTPLDQPEYLDESNRICSQCKSSTQRQMRKNNAEIYQEFIDKSKARGRALFIPQPYSQLPKDYRAEGVCIGDVGVFTPEGGFDYFFNILRPSSDPANPEELPKDFSPLTPPLKPMDVRKFKEFSSGSHLFSHNVSPVQGGTSAELGTAFQSSVGDGAILMIPDGASAEELSNLPIFHKYIKDNAHNFYDFAKNVRGRAVKNGQLHVVYGCRKTTSWGIATFTDTCDLRLEFLPARGTGGNDNLTWNYTMKHGAVNVKAGPDTEENEDLDGAEDGVRLKNQCLFASTLSIRLGTRPRNKRQHKGPVAEKVDKNENSGSSCQSSPSINPQTSASGSGFLNGLSNESPCNRPSEADMHMSSTPYDANELLEEDVFDEYDNEVIIEQNPPSVDSTCPSEVLTEHLLRVAPNASVAIASDKDLAGCILSDDPSTLIDNVCALNLIREEDGVVYFEPKEYHPPQEDVEHILQMINVGECDIEKYLFGPLGKRSLDKMLHSSDSLSSLNRLVTWDSPKFPHRPLFLEQIMAFCSQSAEERLSLSLAPRPSVTELRLKLREEDNTAPNSVNPQTIKSLAESLLLRFTGFSHQDDLDETIWLFEHALTVTSEQTYQYLEVLHNLSICLAVRYQLSKQPHDYKRLVECTNLLRSLDVDKLLAPIKDAVSTTFNTSIPWSMSEERSFDIPYSYGSMMPTSVEKARNRLFALLIGINKYESPNIPQLSGAVADAQAMRRYLIDSLGYSASDITLLVDESATRNTIIEAFQALANDTRIREGEPILIHYAGHGTQINVPASASERPQEVPEAIIPYDYSTAPGHEVQAIPDSALELLLLDIAKKKGNNITVIMDCCRSSSLLDLDGETYSRDNLSLARSSCVNDDDTVTLSPIGPGKVGISNYSSEMSHIRLSACRPGEAAMEDKNGRGVFTKALLGLLQSTDIRNITYEDIMEGLVGLSENQHPQCDGLWKNHYLFRYGDPRPLRPPLNKRLLEMQPQLDVEKSPRPRHFLTPSWVDPDEFGRPCKRARLNDTIGCRNNAGMLLTRDHTVNIVADSALSLDHLYPSKKFSWYMQRMGTLNRKSNRVHRLL